VLFESFLSINCRLGLPDHHCGFFPILNILYCPPQKGQIIRKPSRDPPSFWEIPTVDRNWGYRNVEVGAGMGSSVCFGDILFHLYLHCCPGTHIWNISA
jgi:hypothetical protein